MVLLFLPEAELLEVAEPPVEFNIESIEPVAMRTTTTKIVNIVTIMNTYLESILS